MSKAQQEYFGMVVAGKRPMPPGMTMAQVKDFARTSTKGLPARAKKAATEKKSERAKEPIGAKKRPVPEKKTERAEKSMARKAMPRMPMVPPKRSKK